jgi:hypothetical protein
MKINDKRSMFLAEAFISLNPFDSFAGKRQFGFICKAKAVRASHNAAAQQANFLQVLQVANQARFVPGKQDQASKSVRRSFRVRFLQNIQNIVKQIAVKRHGAFSFAYKNTPNPGDFKMIPFLTPEASRQCP